MRKRLPLACPFSFYTRPEVWISFTCDVLLQSHDVLHNLILHVPMYHKHTHKCTCTCVAYASHTCTHDRGSWQCEIWQCGNLQWLSQKYQFLWAMEFEEVYILISYKQGKHKQTCIIGFVSLCISKVVIIKFQ